MLSSSSSSSPIENSIEIIPNRLYFLTFISSPSVPRPTSTSSIHYFSVDQDFVYEPFYADFGPLNLGVTYRYCRLLEGKLNDSSLSTKKIVHYTSSDTGKRANAACLICLFSLIVLHKSPEESFAPFNSIVPPLAPYRDATYGVCSYQLTILDCLRGVHFAQKLNWFNYNSFDVDLYEYYERVENGDLNWVLPNKFLAFSGPEGRRSDDDGFITFTPEDYSPIFKQLGVTLVIRLNKKQYDRKQFTSLGLNHVDVYLVDGSCPSKEVINRFLDITEREEGAVAVHCKAGLGRTGTLIGCYAIKNYGFPARAWIGWNRICRPGSVLGPQQHFLCEMEQELMAMGRSKYVPPPPSPPPVEAAKPYTEVMGMLQDMSVDEKVTAEKGDDGQGERLCSVKRSNKTSHPPSHPLSTLPPPSASDPSALKSMSSLPAPLLNGSSSFNSTSLTRVSTKSPIAVAAPPTRCSTYTSSSSSAARSRSGGKAFLTSTSTNTTSAAASSSTSGNNGSNNNSNNIFNQSITKARGGSLTSNTPLSISRKDVKSSDDDNGGEKTPPPTAPSQPHKDEKINNKLTNNPNMNLTGFVEYISKKS